MPLAERRAQTVWRGTLPQGSGTLTTGSGAVGELPVTWASRTERPDGKTSPEELLAAAQASCYAMALSLTLSEAGHPPGTLRVEATCALDMVNSAPKVTTMEIRVAATVPGLDADGFQQLAKAEQLCPVANALRGNVAITLQAQVEQPSAA